MGHETSILTIPLHAQLMRLPNARPAAQSKAKIASIII